MQGFGFRLCKTYVVQLQLLITKAESRLLSNVVMQQRNCVVFVCMHAFAVRKTL